MARDVQLLLFDLGGTLFHENGPWEELYARADRALWDVLHEAGVALGSGELYGTDTNLIELYYAEHRGDSNEPTTFAVLDEMLKRRGYSLPSQTLRAALRAMYAVTQTNWDVEEDAISTLRVLQTQGYHIAAITNAADLENTQTLIDKGGIRPYLEYIVSSASFGKRKPHPSIFQEALRHFGLAPSQAIMTGDDYEADIAGACGVRMRAIWITRRVSRPGPIRPEAQPAAVVSRLSEIPAVLERL